MRQRIAARVIIGKSECERERERERERTQESKGIRETGRHSDRWLREGEHPWWP